MALLLFEATTAIAALIKPGPPLYPRAVDETVSAACIALAASPP